MSTWTKSPPELRDRFEVGTAWLLERPGVSRRPMFGYPACFLDGNMFTSLFQDRWVVRLADEDLAALAARGGSEFSPMPGRPMKGYLALPGELATPSGARPWLERALALAESLPPKARR